MCAMKKPRCSCRSYVGVCRRSKYRFVPASKDAVDNLEKMMLEPNVFGGCDGSSCRICLEDMEIGSEVTRMPCSHVFHSGCIDSWLGRVMLLSSNKLVELLAKALESATFISIVASMELQKRNRRG
ncbi:hypothetical protein Scep_008141 [Stephania cephalantha]|uniref:RING-type domain-containing protein n=1 Tax=Stephania cephalantha TaxID=152367 RepID=A0AAP0KD22_9MAGN